MIERQQDVPRKRAVAMKHGLNLIASVLVGLAMVMALAVMIPAHQPTAMKSRTLWRVDWHVDTSWGKFGLLGRDRQEPGVPDHIDLSTLPRQPIRYMETRIWLGPHIGITTALSAYQLIVIWLSLATVSFWLLHNRRQLSPHAGQVVRRLGSWIRNS